MPTKDEVARYLAQRHYQIETGISKIIRYMGEGQIESNPVEPIKLLEINENTIPSGVMPLQFGPSPRDGIHFPSIIVEVTPDEFSRIESHELKLPPGWTLAELIPRTECSVEQ